jgi:hypothetical protein
MGSGAVMEALMTSRNIWFQLALNTTIVGGLALCFGAPARADGDHRAECERRLESDRARIDSDVLRYGDSSHQVNHDVARMNKTRQWCRDHNADWDHDKFDLSFYLTGKR